MFEDLIQNNKDQIKFISLDKCPVCKSTKNKKYGGKFISNNMYIFNFECLSCNSKWKVTVDSHLNIIKVT